MRKVIMILTHIFFVAHIVLFFEGICFASENEVYLELYNKGFDLSKQGKFEEAAEFLKKSNELKKDYFDSNLELSYVLMEMEQYQEAMIYSREAIKLDSNSYIAYNNHGYSLLELGQLQEGIKYLKKSLWNKFKFLSF